jgi:hypothetical protein
VTVTITSLPALRVARVSASVRDEAEIGAAVEALTARAAAAGLTGPAVHTYFGGPDTIEVTVGVVVPSDGVELPAVDRAATVVHQGEVDLDEAWQALDEALAERGLESYGLHRRVDVAGGVELQVPVRDLGTCP